MRLLAHFTTLIYNFGMCNYNYGKYFSAAVRLSLLLAFAFCAVSCSRESAADREERIRLEAEREAEIVEKKRLAEIEAARLFALRDFAEKLPLEEQVNQLFFININGNKDFSPVEYRDGKPLIPGGFIFFSFNLADTREEITAFTASIKKYCDGQNCVQPFLAADQEGGDVARLRKINSKMPSALEVAENFSLETAYELYESQAMQMSALGFNMNIAPVAEPLTEENKNFLGDRSFGDVRAVENFGASFLMAFQSNGVACVVKHFPGNTNTDPHTGLPNIKLSMEEFRREMVAPFSALCAYSPAAILMSHALTQNVDAKTPACLSDIWIGGVIRGEMKYDGIVISDDIFMAALAENGFPPEVASVRAIEAGGDMIMISEKRYRNEADILIKKARGDQKFAEKILESCVRILNMKEKFGLFSLPAPIANKLTLANGPALAEPPAPLANALAPANAPATGEQNASR